ncbi:hypothetical protein [Aerococcus kribbianus]|uniref:DUF1659 domain-containing protein n=1 Tax=Aerococcus kribbianus TaxID=2999064 RepID=A0A9X3JDZ4_9LACT|nr:MULTISPECIES: hypothetical protein [unclassified Aerococcus]MCZ0718118.1 hypothetical protein [Aerococcus sp. YH-aer221]MCZ0726313.1 hypothetical protein [Aerococcus sp. YH-aer222]
MKQFNSAKLQIISHDTDNDKDITLTLNQLAADAKDEDVATIQTALAGIIQDPISNVTAIEHYDYL